MPVDIEVKSTGGTRVERDVPLESEGSLCGSIGGGADSGNEIRRCSMGSILVNRFITELQSVERRSAICPVYLS